MIHSPIIFEFRQLATMLSIDISYSPLLSFYLLLLSDEFSFHTNYLALLFNDFIKALDNGELYIRYQSYT